MKPGFCFPHVFLLGAQKAATTSMFELVHPNPTPTSTPNPNPNPNPNPRFELVHDLGMACPANTLLSGVPRTNNTLNAIKFQNVRTPSPNTLTPSP